jgi:glycogen operon protein
LPEPLGVTLVDGGANVAIPAPGAEAIAFCSFAPDGAEARVRLPARTGDVFHGFVAGVTNGTRHGLRAYGPWAPWAGQRFNPAKLLVDPWATALDRPFVLHASMFDTGDASDATDSAPFMPKCIAAQKLPPVEAVRRPGPHVIYELHVRGFTKRHPDIPPELRGTFAGLGHPAAIAHLSRLGVTLVELMPSAAWIDERHLPPLGLANYWGYNPVAMLAPDPRLAPGGMDEVRASVAALHEAGIGVILDVVLNHTGEGDHLGPTLSLRGLGVGAYYRLRPENAARHVDDTGCGNTLALDRPWPMRLAMDALRHWALAAGIDGFRLDLAATLGRRPDGFDAHAPLLAAMRQDPVLRDRLIIAEPWDIGQGGYRLGAFVAGWGEWNDRFRDDVRRFWRGDAGMLGVFATRLAGSADLFTPPRRASDSVNFLAAHDGFTLTDLVSHAARRNEANGEHGQDGAVENYSWNSGVEGPSDDPAIVARRKADVRALLATLLCARGTPMLAMGDECGRSQGGNNNAYCHDSPLTWLDWQGADQDLIAFTAALIAARRSHPALHDDRALTGLPVDDASLADVLWLHPDGTSMAPHDWSEARAMVAVLFARQDRIALAINGGSSAVPLVLPPPRWGYRWSSLADSSDPARVESSSSIAARAVSLHAEAPAGGRSAGAPDPAQLARLARAAGIATYWHDIGGRHHAVPTDTVSALLTALNLPHATISQARESEAQARTRISESAPGTPCFLPADLAAGTRRFGISAQTYALRRANDQGIGDYSALAALASEARRQGAALLGLSPPHALMPVDRTRASPYQPSDRRMLEPVLLDVAALPGFESSPAVGAALAAEDSAIETLRAKAHVDYPGVWHVKRAVLHAAWRSFSPAHSRWGAFTRFRDAGGEALERFAVFTAAAEHIGHTDIARWPAELRDPRSAAAATFAAAHADAVSFHVFLQFLCDAQLAGAAAQGAGLYRDLAVGAAPDSAEVWAGGDSVLRNFSIGAPPDPLGPLGQVWGLPPPNPHAPTFADDFEALVRANMRHAAALRIDHVMGLSRLFVVPHGAPGSAGCYLSYPMSPLLDRLARASQQACCLVVGEDLGTVPEGFSDITRAANILSYRVLWFERDGERFRSPAAWPAAATACVSTHDLPPLAGWWNGSDIAERAALGLLSAAEAAEAQRGRTADRAALMAAIGEPEARAAAPFDPELAAAIHAHVAATQSALMLVQADDLAGATIGTNLPGTDAERPNWRHRLPVAVEALCATPVARAILAACTARRG